jgi:hypothetical protein
MMWTGDIFIASNLASSLLQSSNDRISSFRWIRGSKLGYLTSFSHLNLYFLILVFLCNRYLLVSSRLSRLHWNLISCPIFSYLWHSKVMPHLSPHFFGTENMDFSKQDARRNLVQESVLVFFPTSTFCRRFLVQLFIGQLQIIPFLLT